MGILKERIMNGKENGKGIKEKRDGKEENELSLFQFILVFLNFSYINDKVRNCTKHVLKVC